MNKSASESKKSVPTLDNLPPPPEDNTGWPWTEQSDPLPETQPNGEPWPKISIVTPSYNQGQFIEETIRSVLLQEYPNLEYIVIDGESTDGTIEILAKYDQWIDYWVSEPDSGQSNAINKGFRQATGEYGGWLNSDDWLCKNALRSHAKTVGFEHGKLYVGVCLYYHDPTKIERHKTSIKDFEDLIRLPEHWRNFNNRGHIVQPETLFPVDHFCSVGGLNRDNHFTMDYELWGRLLQIGLEIESTSVEFAFFRVHEEQKTTNHWAVTESLTDTAVKLVQDCSTWSKSKKEKYASIIYKHKKRVKHQMKYEKGILRKTKIPKKLAFKIYEAFEYIE